MAVWQFDLSFVPRGLTYPPPTVSSYELPALPEPSVVEAHAMLSSVMGAPWQMCEGILVFGQEDSHRVDLCLGDDGSGELMARIDARTPSEDFRALICHIADAVGCEFFSTELWSVIGVTRQALDRAMAASRASSFAADPTDFLRRIPPNHPS